MCVRFFPVIILGFFFFFFVTNVGSALFAVVLVFRENKSPSEMKVQAKPLFGFSYSIFYTPVPRLRNFH